MKLREQRRGSSFHRRANVIVLVAVMLPVLVGFTAMTVDVGSMYTTRADLQNAVDAAALSGASGLNLGINEVRLRAKAAGALNTANGQGVTLTDNEIQLGSWDATLGVFTPWIDDTAPEFDAVRITAHTELSYFFASAFGPDSKTISASATATFGVADAFDVMLVQDISGSFTSALPLAKLANESLVNCLEGHTRNSSRIGMVTFTGTSQVVAPFEAVSTGFSNLVDTVVNLQSCCSSWGWGWWWGNTCGDRPQCSTYTNIAAGLETALTEIVNAAAPTGNIGQAIVLVSDGRPQAVPGSGLTDADLRAQAVAAADAAAAQGLSVYTVYFAGSSYTPAADAAFLASLVRGDGTFQQTDNPDDLSSLLWKVCSDLPLMLVE